MPSRVLNRLVLYQAGVDDDDDDHTCTGDPKLQAGAPSMCLASCQSSRQRLLALTMMHSEL